MTFGLSGAALAGIAVGGATLISANKQSKAAESAAQTQAQAAVQGTEASIRGTELAIAEQRRQSEEQRRQFEKVQELLAPYVQAGGGALGGYSPYQAAGTGALPTLQQFAQAGAPALEQQQALIGLRGPDAQQQAIEALQSGPQFQALQQQGENAILQSASATGGLRGGNLQGALAQFRPQLLSELIGQQYSRLGGLASVGGTVAQNLATAGMDATGELARLGQASAAGTGAAVPATNSAISNLLAQQGASTAAGLQQQGAAMAGGQLAQGRAFGAIPSAISGGLGLFSGLGGKF
jgi:hypothetical protein